MAKNITELPPAASLLDDDLLYKVSGTTDESVTFKLLKDSALDIVVLNDPVNVSIPVLPAIATITYGTALNTFGKSMTGNETTGQVTINAPGVYNIAYTFVAPQGSIGDEDVVGFVVIRNSGGTIQAQYACSTNYSAAKGDYMSGNAKAMQNISNAGDTIEVAFGATGASGTVTPFTAYMEVSRVV